MMYSDLVKQLSVTSDANGAVQVIAKYMKVIGLPIKSEYSKDEMLRFCDALRASGETLLKIAGNCIKTRTIVSA